MSKLSILLIEDEAIIAKDIKVTLEAKEYAEVDVALSVDAARERYVEKTYDLVISDINLNASIDGIELVKELCQIRKTPVVYLSAYADESTIKKAETSSPYAYLLKPFNSNQLKLTINLAILNSSKEHAEVELNKKNVDLLKSLTKREQEILFVLASGKPSKEAGDMLHIATSTVEKHKQNIKEKLNLKTIGELVNFAVSTKTVSLD
ncbi:DNA-binding response regulator [Reichenbachiella sp.]|uniref:DNA-binding response regulator n=1 Tax=Reichenbachiella sp. TaxID=2184521 RepID=UPI003B5999D2